MKRLILAAALAAAASPAAAETYEIDGDHSSISFRVRHLVGKVTGKFTRYEGHFDYEEGKPKSWKANAVIETASIDTGVEARDKHLRQADFFDAARCPKIEFKSTKVSDVAGNKAKLYGDLTMRCVTKPIVLELELGGVAKDPWGNVKAGATATGKINRTDWGLEWNKKVETGGVLVGEEIELTLEIEGTVK